ncbi:MAG TPA: GWxTD domain-containing protein [Pyrinomonadaceae bacterium]|nr:GWxTD domain-containing protein [Pyrinomonadaceae bacterium]
MSTQKIFRRVLATLFVLALAVPAIFAQDVSNPNRKRNEKPELKKAYKDWLNNDVAYIITPQERDAFKKLTTDEERENFIELFWRRRDPDPDTDENEYREEYYERIAYANEHYASGIPGWKTDRGRVYIMYGKPDELETHPSGGNYDRPSYEGGGNTSTYPFEIWFYRYLPGIGSGIEIEFVDPTGSGEYHIARSPDEKDALLHVPGAGLTLSEQLGLSDKADRISGIGYSGGGTGYQREQDSPFRRLELMAQLSQAPQLKNADMDKPLSITGGGVLEENPLNFDVRVDFFRQSDQRVITAVTIQTDNKDLSFEDSGGLQRARMNIFGRVIAVSGKRVGVFEDSVETTATPAELVDAKERKSAYQKAMPLAPGVYKVEIVVRDVKTGATGVRKVGFEVPKYDPKQLGASTLVLASKLENADASSAGSQFVIRGTKVIPNISGNFRRGQPVGLYLQVYNVGTDQTTLRPSVDVQYVLTKDGKEIGKQVEDWNDLADNGQSITLARLINTGTLAPGEYGLEVRINDRVSGQTLKQSREFTITQ